MRNIINISLPPVMTKVVRQAVKRGQYASTSEFFRHLVRQWVDEQSVADVMESEREYKAGKGRALRSLEDLR